MRSFISLDLPDSCLDPLERRIGGLRAGRPVPRENLHLTLAFLGDQPEDALEELHAELEMLRLPGPELAFGGLGWVGPGKAQSLAVEVEPVSELLTLQAEVARRARRLGMVLDRRPFRPHVTLVRFRRHVSPGEEAALHGFLSSPPVVTDAPCRAMSFSLQRSTLSGAGARYETLASYPLL